MTEKFSNFARTTIVSGIDDDDTSLVVEYATNFPTSGDFRLRCGNEIMLCTAVAGTTLTVTRGIEGTTPAAHGAGTPIAHVMTAASLDAAIDDRIALPRASDILFGADLTYAIGSSTERASGVFIGDLDMSGVLSVGIAESQGSDGLMPLPTALILKLDFE